ncbi:MAG: shikimate 5-dehydrogenase, shikimate dehydrogenase [Candidatus Peregrinibacteria bacterium GW2011_GWF2_39_17]|nr:MAG: shikimate 5-dehydrogenase, shikimate dehydrogenase [Candidatus Peregrinibacteria bacterium GW2011_GWF2_39_17]HCW31955.1 shikimate dehydrogenase [Candidatus Peregrinibacteria bacterium]
MKNFCIIAHPVEHSLSPIMHNAAFKAMQMEAVFVAYDVLPENLQNFMSTKKGWAGLAVSIPHKETIGQYLDGIDEIAKKIGAVNTVYRHNDQHWGTNTDAPGFLNALKEVMPDLSGKRVVVIGAGGAARAVISALKPLVGFLTIINRTVPKGVALAKEFECRYGGKIEDMVTETPDLLVNTTSVGLEALAEPNLVPLDFLKPSMLIVDIAYRQNGTTKLISEAQQVGAKFIEGRQMLLHQGMLQFELWTGQKAPREVMERALKGL